MELIDCLISDHDIIRKFISELDSTDNNKIKNKIFIELLVFLRAHFRAEEMAVYSKSLKASNYEINEMTLDGYEEHHLLEDLIYRIKNAEKDDQLWISRIKDFCQVLDLHLSSEETDFFPELKNYFNRVDLDKAAIIYLKNKKAELILAEQDQSRNYDFYHKNLLN